MTLIKCFDTLFQEKKIPVTKIPIQEGLVLYQVDFSLRTTHTLRMEMIVEDKEVSDVQIVYRQIGFLSDYDKKSELLTLINELNEIRTGYYRLFLAADGEIYLKTLLRSDKHIQPIYDILIQGPAIVNGFLADIEKITGLFNNVTES